MHLNSDIIQPCFVLRSSTIFYKGKKMPPNKSLLQWSNLGAKSANRFCWQTMHYPLNAIYTCHAAVLWQMIHFKFIQAAFCILTFSSEHKYVCDSFMGEGRGNVVQIINCRIVKILIYTLLDSFCIQWCLT